MILENLIIRRSADWRGENVSYIGVIKIKGESADVELRVDDVMCRKIIAMCADELVEVAIETSKLLKSEIIEQTRQVGSKP